MARKIVRHSACLALLGCLAFAAATVARPVCGEEGKPPAKETKKIKDKVRKGRHRLPPCYAEVVNDEQREKIYKILDEYRPKIEALKAQLKALQEEQNEKIAAVLTPEQKQQIVEAEAEAKAKRKADKPKLKKPAEKNFPGDGKA